MTSDNLNLDRKICNRKATREVKSPFMKISTTISKPFFNKIEIMTYFEDVKDKEAKCNLCPGNVIAFQKRPLRILSFSLSFSICFN